MVVMGKGEAPLLTLFSDFGCEGPYVGQVLAVWAGLAPTIPRVNLFAESPAFDVEAGAHLLYAYTRHLPKYSVVEAVVDPGVGGERSVCVMRADDLWFCGPDNGLLSVVARRSSACDAWVVDWRPKQSSSTFHGRDIFAPIAAHVAMHGVVPDEARQIPLIDAHFLPDTSQRIIFVDPYGNLITGIYGQDVSKSQKIEIGNRILSYADRFELVNEGEGFWYINANGLLEVAVNKGNAADVFACKCGDSIGFIE